MGVFLVLVLWFGGLPAFDFAVFQDMAECLKAKATVEERLKEANLKVMYLECKNDPGEQLSAAN